LPDITKGDVMTEKDWIAPQAILDAMNVGVYVCDRNRKIAFWSKMAEAITGWRAEDVMGHSCRDNILNHIDKDGRPLCGEESCPLYRTMVTGVEAHVPIIVFARHKDGRRIPMQVNVAPLRNAAGEVIGGVETFRDMTAEMPDLRRAKQIQDRINSADLPPDARLRLSTLYRPKDIVGGDFYAVQAETGDRYTFMLADMVGHGLAAALYSVHLNLVWHKYHDLRIAPGAFAAAANEDLVQVFGPDCSFATAVCGVFDVRSGVLTLAGAGGPPPLLLRAGGRPQWLRIPGTPLGIATGSAYEEQSTTLRPGDRVMICTDGAFEVHNALREELGHDGFLHILEALGFPQAELRMERLEEELLKFSNAIRLQDDLTMILLEYLG
jgi:sigma-B regulation protein RsbU (phosphoserine phosphatase)